jgi:iron complex outermembrane receptor protein
VLVVALIASLQVIVATQSPTISGRVRDASTHAPIAGVSIQAPGRFAGTVSDSAGAFTLAMPAPGMIQLSRLGYRTSKIQVDHDTILDVELTRAPQSLESIQVTAIRGNSDAPISEKTVSKAEIERAYSGQETPILLAAQPGITAYAENGASSNYSYMRIRGIDQTRINITLDGVPLNEPEDQGLYFANFPDFANSIESVQIQRGVGTSTNGVASYAGSVNFESVSLASAARGGELQVGRGWYNTSRASAEYQTGLIAHGLAAYGRFSTAQTDGYRYDSGNRSHSWFASGGWFGTRDVIKLTTFGGYSANEEAYLATPLSLIERDPRTNPLSVDEGNGRTRALHDRFHQRFAGIGWTRALTPDLTLATTAYGFDAGGYYNVSFDGTMYDYHLHSRWGGLVSALRWSSARGTASLGFHGALYNREHWLLAQPDLGSRLYDNTGYKDEGSFFAKASRSYGRTTIFGDLQMRTASFRYEPTPGTGVSAPRVRWSFFNPKVGVTRQLTSFLAAYASTGLNGREPTRSDMLGGADDVDATTAPLVLPLTRVHPESVRDVEVGATYRRATVTAQANVFVMSFHDEIAPIGEVNALGVTLRKNVARSVRRGVEGDATWRPVPNVTLLGNASFTDARIHAFHDDATDVTYRDVVPLLTPRLVSNQGVRIDAGRHASLDIDGRYTSRMMLGNDNDARSTVPASYFVDAGVMLRAGSQALLVQLRNATNARVYTSGYSDGTEPNYYLLAPRNLMVTAKIRF